MIGEIEIMQLAPLAQGMAYETLAAESGSPYCQQLLVKLEDIDTEAFQASVDATFAAHPQLLISVEHEDLPTPMGVVIPGARIPWTREDWRGMNESAFADRLSRYLDLDRTRGFDLTCPPLVRAVLIRETDRRWRFCLTYHHLLMDGWSSALVFDELAERYAALRSGRKANVPRRRPYADFIEWQTRSDPTASARWWTSFLADAPSTPLPMATRAGAQRAASVYGRMESNRWQRFREVCRMHALTPAVATTGLWAVLLGRLLGESDVVFGMTHAGRPDDLPGADEMIGLFINTVPMRVQLDEAATIGRFFDTMRDNVAQARHHGHLALTQIQSFAGANRASFETLVVFENYPVGSLATTSALGVIEASNREEGHYPGALIIEPQPDRLDIAFHYNGGRLSDADAALIISRYVALLDAFITADRDSLICSLDHRIEADCDAFAALATRDDAGPAYLLGDLFMDVARRFPDTIALKQGGVASSYAAVAERASTIAAALQRHGIGPGKIVGIGLQPGIERYQVLLATFIAGACAFVIDTSQPDERLAAAEGLVLPDLVVVGDIPLNGSDADRHIHVSTLQAGGRHQPARPALHDLAYIITTSGSTGVPKPVGVPYGAIGRLAAVYRNLEPPRVVLNMLQLHFDASYAEVLQSLMAGGTLVIPAEGEDFQQAIENHAVTAIAATPSTLATLDPERSLALRMVMVGGETLPPELASRWLNHCSVANCYGPTEATVYATRADLVAGAPVTIGTPVPFTSAYVLSSALRPVGIGEPGELYLAGPALAAGYVGLPGQTARAFLPDPFGPPGSRMYRTGDFASINHDGTLHFIGRRDGQVKLRGRRVELQDIDIALATALECSGREIAVAMVPGPDGRSRLVACTTQHHLSLPALLDAAKNRLAAPFYPQALLKVSNLPINANGKLDRQALAAMAEQADLFRASQATGQGSAAEQKVAAVLAEALGITAIAPDADFFHVGGDSIVALQAASIARRVGLPITPAMILSLRTASAISANLDLDQTRDQKRVLVPLEDGTGMPVILVGGAGGGPEAMLAVAQGLASRKVMAFEPPRDAETLGALADNLAAATIAAGLTGALVVVGHSFGAYIATEAVRRLRHAGTEAHLVVIDAPAPLPERIRPEMQNEASLLASLEALASEITGRAPCALPDFPSVAASLKAAGIADDDDHVRSLISQTRQSALENAGYIAEPLPLPGMLLIRASERGDPLRSFEPPAASGDDWGWSRLIANGPASLDNTCTITFARGNHISMLRGDAGRALGAIIRTYIDFELNQPA